MTEGPLLACEQKHYVPVFSTIAVLVSVCCMFVCLRTVLWSMLDRDMPEGWMALIRADFSMSDGCIVHYEVVNDRNIGILL